MSTPLVRADQLVKRYGQFEAVSGVSFAIEPGETFGFLGPNGAGKTSTMKMVSSVAAPTSGELQIFGLNPQRHGAEVRSRLGVVTQEDSLETELTVLDNLYIFGRYHGLSRAVIRERSAELLEFAQLVDKKDEKVDALSGGMKRRLTIARALINKPELVILDEPTTGLDPQARHLLWERLYRLKSDGVTLVITTHYMDEAEQLCDRLVIMDKGLIVAEGSPRDLISAHSSREVLELRFGINEHAHHSDSLRPFAQRLEVLPDRILLYVHDGDETLAAIHGAGIVPVSALVRRASLEDVFLRLTGRTLVD
jgi:lipooligosaccharide transport system ATP-binding protein